MRTSSIAAYLVSGISIMALASPAVAQQRRFEIRAGSLQSALDSYARQSARPVIYKADEIRGSRSRGYRGTASAPVVLDALLAGTGFAARVDQSGAVAIVRTSTGAAAADDESDLAQRADARPAESQDIVVTGSLIATAAGKILPTPTFTLKAEDIQARGFTSVAQAIQQSPYATGSVAGPSQGFTQGARTARLFGFGPGFTKYLIDGRPMGMFPDLYGNTTTFVDLSTIPTQLVERIDILPGGQSSLYGSDAIAGVVNITLRKSIDAPMVDARVGVTGQGGGRSWRVSGADGFGTGRLNVIVGGQYEAIEPIWGFQRKLTGQPFQEGSTPGLPVQGIALQTSDFTGTIPITADRCAPAANLFRGSLALTANPQGGSYCGFSTTGYTTITNREKRYSLFGHATYDIGNDASLYADVLYGHAKTDFTYTFGSTYYDSSATGAPFYIPAFGKSFFFTRSFAPEELGGLDNLMSPQTTTSLYSSVGLKGSIGGGAWRYDINYVRNQQDLTTRRRVLLAEPLTAYFTSLLGPVTGTFDDPFYGRINRYSSNLSGFFAPLPASAVASFSAIATTRASTNSNWGRGLMSNGHLFTLPGGDAGVAVAVEGGNERWNYVPDPGLTNGRFYGFQTDVSGGGRRSFLAGVGELRLPVVSFATLSGSLRYDRYFVDDVQTGKASYNVAAEINPLRQIMLRARYGTAFKAPTLADLYQGPSSRLAQDFDYARCAQGGLTIATCNITVLYTQRLSGNTALRPITADVADVGIVLTPVRQVEIAVDFLRWRIANGVSQESSSTILREEALCRARSTAIDAQRCAAVISYVTRDASGVLTAVYAPKINVSRQRQDAIVSSLNAVQPIGRFGQLNLSAAYTLSLKRSSQATPTSPVIDLLASPQFSSDFRSRANASLGWSIAGLTSTVYVDRVGRSPNQQAGVFGPSSPGAGRLPSLTTVNLGLGYAVTPKIQLSGNVVNLFDAGPPLDRTYPGYTAAPYNAGNYNLIGRSFMVMVSAGF